MDGTNGNLIALSGKEISLDCTGYKPSEISIDTLSIEPSETPT